ncbi:hypothetical protein AMELA_G00133250 [Ameiurus melas]|uniref:Uncharacterized protein n=1 Tax=Ameiurus melas TaxID=219545 RepID=A0A7J6AJ54_AMEME|nr:hypothetical protein AMELA_G00133250 [Ameiurus melas]
MRHVYSGLVEPRRLRVVRLCLFWFGVFLRAPPPSTHPSPRTGSSFVLFSRAFWIQPENKQGTLIGEGFSFACMSCNKTR